MKNLTHSGERGDRGVERRSGRHSSDFCKVERFTSICNTDLHHNLEIYTRSFTPFFEIYTSPDLQLFKKADIGIDLQGQAKRVLHRFTKQSVNVVIHFFFSCNISPVSFNVSLNNFFIALWFRKIA